MDALDDIERVLQKAIIEAQMRQHDREAGRRGGDRSMDSWKHALDAERREKAELAAKVKEAVRRLQPSLWCGGPIHSVPCADHVTPGWLCRHVMPVRSLKALACAGFRTSYSLVPSSKPTHCAGLTWGLRAFFR